MLSFARESEEKASAMQSGISNMKQKIGALETEMQSCANRTDQMEEAVGK